MTKPSDVERESSPADFGTYQIWLFVITQLGYLPIAGSMLATTFFEPSKFHCDRLQNVSSSPMENGEFESFLFEQEDENFHSLLVHWNKACQHSTIPTVISFFVMFGGVIGAFMAGYLADRFGRKPVVVGAMSIVCLGNLLLTFLGQSHWVFTAATLGSLGAASGGYMVVNMVLVVEALEHAKSRLLVVSMNGWPVGMSFVAICAWFARHWWTYHCIVAITAGIFVIVLQTFSLESVRWLTQHNRHVRADKIRLIIGNRNGTHSSSSVSVQLPDSQRLTKLLSKEVDLECETSTLTPPTVTRRHYSYIDLFVNNSVRSHLLALLYCFTVSSVVSFGIYFNMEALPGSRYVNLLSMGALKFSLGLVPYFVSRWLGRRPIALLSTGVSTLAGWSLVVAFLALRLGNHWLITALSIMVTASLDPTWKINHLYSTELFPTVVRNMARAICNVGARLGGVIAPGIVFLRHSNAVLPYIVFSSLLTVQWLISFVFLPETKDHSLVDVLQERAPAGVDSDESEREK